MTDYPTLADACKAIPPFGTEAYAAYELGFKLGMHYADDPMRNMLLPSDRAAAWYAPEVNAAQRDEAAGIAAAAAEEANCPQRASHYGAEICRACGWSGPEFWTSAATHNPRTPA